MRTKKEKTERRRTDTSALGRIAGNVGITLLLSLVLWFLLLFLGTSVAYATNDPTRWILPAGTVALFMTAFFGGFIAAKIASAPILTAGVAGALFLLVGFLLSLFLSPEATGDFSPMAGLALRGGAWLVFLVGSLLGRKRAPGKRTHKKHGSRH